MPPAIPLIAIDQGGGAFILAFYQRRIPRCQHIKANGTQCGSPGLRNGEYCYFHSRWRSTHVDLSQSAHHVSSMFDLPVLEDADSIQMAVGQIMRMIVCRQVEPRAAGLLLYGLQIASANLRRTRFEPSHREQVVVDLYSVASSPESSRPKTTRPRQTHDRRLIAAEKTHESLLHCGRSARQSRKKRL